MFPHAFDRYNILGYIIQQSRESLELTQQQLADKAHVAQGTISHVESLMNLMRIINEGYRPISRKTLIATTARGLNLSPNDINALLWLLEGNGYKPLDESELPDHTNSPAITYSIPNEALRSHVLHMLRKALGDSKTGRLKKMNVAMLTEWDEKHQLVLRRELLKMDSKPGQRLLVSKYPSYLACSQQVHEEIYMAARSEENRRKFQVITNRRRQLFHENLKMYGERSIHSVESLRRYLRKTFSNEFSYAQRRAHVESWVELVKKHKLYEIGLAQTEPEMEFVIKSPFAACLRGTSRNISPNTDSVICGPLYVYWDNTPTVYSFFLDFEREWFKISPQWRDRERVISWLEKLLKA